jgi:hypothetical protein
MAVVYRRTGALRRGNSGVEHHPSPASDADAGLPSGRDDPMVLAPDLIGERNQGTADDRHKQVQLAKAHHFSRVASIAAFVPNPSVVGNDT